KIVLPWGRGFNLRHFKRLGIDLIHSHANFGAGLAAMALAKWAKLPLVLTCHTLWEQYAHYVPLPHRFLMWFNARYTRWMCDQCALVIAPTDAMRKVLTGYGTRARVEVLPTGLTADVFRYAGAHKADFGVCEEKLVLSTAGRIGLEKRFHVLLDALAAVKDRLRDWHLCLAGDGPLRAKLEAQ